MERIRKIQEHPLFREQYELLQDAEKARIFCGHSMAHFADVARLMYIYSLEDHAGLDRSLIYAAALLHDIGRYEQISLGTPHHLSGARIAGVILADCGFSSEEISAVQDAVKSHRKASDEGAPPLSRYLYRADKQSRNCFCCPAKEECDWPDTKKNLYFTY